MKSRSSLVAFAATLLLHLGLAAAIVFVLPDSQDNQQRQEPVKVALLQPEAAPQATPPAAASPAPQSEKQRPQRDSRPATKPDTSPRVTPAAPPLRTEATTESKQPVPSTAGPSPSASSPPQAAAPATVVPPQALVSARTSATDAAYASTNRKPPYPRISQSNDEEGTVILRVLVKADGTAGSVEIKQSSGYPRLDESARNTVQTWRFSPATVDGKPVTEWYQVAIPFTLQRN